MNIEYMWIEELHKQKFACDINFGGKHRISYDKDNNALTISRNEDYIKGFFNVALQDYEKRLANITNVTAFIGKNGSGKSSILSYICGLPITGFNLNGVVVIRNDNDLLSIYICKSLFEGAKKKFKLINEGVENKFCINDLGKCIAGNRKVKDRDIEKVKIIVYGYDDLSISPIEEFVKDIQMINYSGVFSVNDVFKQYINKYSDNRIVDISTNYLVRNDCFGLYSDNREDRDGRSELIEHKYNEIIRQINFACSDKKKFVQNINIPEKIYIEPDAPPDKIDSGEKNELLKKLGALFEEEKRTLSEYEVYRVNYYHVCVANYLYELRNYHNLENVSEVLFDTLANYNDIFTKTRDSIKNITETLDSAQFQEVGKNILQLLDIVDARFLEKKVSDEISILSHIYFDFTEGEEKSKAEEFVEVFKKCFVFTPFLRFEWRDMSSGETALLNMFARFNYVVDKFSRSENKMDDAKITEINKNIIVFFDEADVYLHPQWKKEQLNALLVFLRGLFASDGIERNIQMIMATNDPIISSDIPVQNIVFLERGDGGYIVNNEVHTEQTFAANIHSLYTNSFFVNNGLIGDFAKHKIADVVRWIRSEDKEFFAIEDEMKKIIPLIGEPVLRSKICEMYRQRLDLSYSSLDKRVRKLEDAHIGKRYEEN